MDGIHYMDKYPLISNGLYSVIVRIGVSIVSCCIQEKESLQVVISDILYGVITLFLKLTGKVFIYVEKHNKNLIIR